MAKRFTDTDKWKKPLLKSLPPEYKLLWFYITDDCDHAGIWNVDLEIASLRIGFDFTEPKCLEVFKDKITVFDNGTKWFLPSFIEFQYGELKPNNKVHQSVIKQLEKYDLIKNKGLDSPLQGAKDKEKEKDKEKDKEQPDQKNDYQPSIIPEPTGEKFSIEECLRIALRDERWAKANKTNETELEEFNAMLERIGTYHEVPIEYKRYFGNWKAKGKLDLIKKDVQQTTSQQTGALAYAKRLQEERRSG